jgi:hypothetical protein
MSRYYLVATKYLQGVGTTNARYATVADALRSVDELLGDGVPAVCIIDNEGNLILPADKIRLRLNPSSGYVRVP